jgi:hypothetical protein
MAAVQIQNLSTRRLACLCLALSLGFSAAAQERYQLSFHGLERSVNASGNETRRSITTRSLIRDWSNRAGVSNYHNLVLAFHRNVDSRGDAIEVVNRKTGEMVTTVFPLFFPESATSGTARTVSQKRFAYVYNLYHSEFSRGTAILNERTSINRQGVTNRFIVSGEMLWYEIPEGAQPLRIDTGTFKIGRKLK